MIRLKQRRSVLLLLVVVAFALVAAACSDSDSGGDTTTTEGMADTTTTTEGMADTTTTTEGGDEMMGTTLSGLTKVDDLTFTVELQQADPEFPLEMAYDAFFPLPSVAYDDPAAFEESPIGNGPFMMDGVWEHDVQIPTVAYPDYQGDDGAQIDELSFQIYADPATAYNDALGGNLDVLDFVTTDFLSTYKQDFPDSNAEALTTGFGYIGFPAYLDQLTADHRRALSMATDRALIAEQIFEGARDPASSVIPSNLRGRDEVCDYWDFNPDEAKALWDAAGDPGPITVWFNSGGGHEQWIEAMVNMWGQYLGIDTSTVTFETLEFSEYLPVLDNQEATGPFRLGWGMDYPSPINFLEPLYASYNTPPVGSNDSFYNNPDFDAALAAGKEVLAQTGDIEQALPDLYEAEDILCDDVGVMPIYFSKSQYVWNPSVSNVYVDAYADVGYSNLTSDDGAVSTYIDEPEHLFPTNSNESEGVAVLRALFRGLMNLDAETNEMYLANAESITSEDGGLTWTVVLKDGWTFHNGEPVTSDSYINAWSYGADGANGQQNNSFYANIVGYDELNPEG